MAYSAIKQLLDAVNDKHKAKIGLESKRLRRSAGCWSMEVLNSAIGRNEVETPSKVEVFSGEVRF